MILAKSTKADSPGPYWLIFDNHYGLDRGFSTIKDCFEAIKENSPFFVPEQYTITDTCIISKTNPNPDIVDEIIATFPDCTYEEFCQQYPELCI